LGEYSELHRPQFHFSARENWLNDPNGLVYHNGIWHLFFQHNIEAPTWGKMWWGHAVSEDLIHWRQVEHALYPDEMGSMFSGSAVVDYDNTADFGKGALLLFYTAAGMHAEPKRPFTVCLAYSLDNGKQWTKFEGNPIVDWMEADNRDPKVVWHESTRRWIMVLYLADDRYCLLRSADARTWTRFQDIALEGDDECPDFFPILDESGTERWLMTGAHGTYRVGSFDGAKFNPETESRSFDPGRNAYAAQTWSNAPDGRCIQISWMAGGVYPEMPFNQQMSIPVELSLKGSGDNVVLVRQPVKELNALRQRSITIERQTISRDNPLVAATDAKLFDVSFTVRKQEAIGFYAVIRGHSVAFDWNSNTLIVESSGTLKTLCDRSNVSLPDEPNLSVRFLVDKTSIEVFINGGDISASFCFLPSGYIDPLVLRTYSGDQVIEDFELHELRSVWLAE
jgi:sucrose-6-phosphate hydrolase SacC (GH32 family)